MDATPGLEPKGMVCCGHQRSKGQKVSGQELRTEVSKWDTVSSSQPNYFPLRKVLCTVLIQRKVLDKREAVPSQKRVLVGTSHLPGR